MNDKIDREIMQMALEALYSAPLDHNSIKSSFFERRHHAIIALRERLAQQAEPVAFDPTKALRLEDALEQQAAWEARYGPSELEELLQDSATLLRRQHAEIERLKAQRNALLSLIANDAFAASFQSLAQYRSALLKETKGKK